jgi:uncharacterized lipoprotein YddW (UPF0748 family)
MLFPSGLRRALAVGCAALACAAAPARGQRAPDAPPPVAREFRGVWVATVGNIDWPSKPGLSTIRQQDELLQILDRAAELKLNAVVLQVRPASDALYASSLEPWSEFLTGTMGQAPEPFYDPLAFAVREAHLRGLELHAWFNPYRARAAESRSPASATHVTRTRPSAVRRYGTQIWLDPGDADVRRRAEQVILDVVRRYDIDAVHIDDYFYPYVENNARGRAIEFPDAPTYERYRRSGGTLERGDWRRQNVDTFVRELYTAVKAAKPGVRVGISPFGIWRPGSPPGIEGLDAYTELFADSRKWLANGWLDYSAPQLYFGLGRPRQDHTALLAWWVSQNTRGRHIWPGLYTSRVGAGREPWTADAFVEQIRLTRAQPGATGHVHFSMRALQDNRGGLATRLAAETYREPALVPASPWLDREPPLAASVELRDSTIADSVVLALRPGGEESSWLYVVRGRYGARWSTDVIPGYYAFRSLPRTRDGAPLDRVVVQAVDRVGNLSASRTVGVPRTPVLGEGPGQE